MRNHLRLALVLFLTISTLGLVAPAAEATAPCYTTSGTVITGYGTCSGAVVIESGITEIGYTAFMNSGVTSIDIPASVRTIGDSAFYRLESLTAVTFHEGLITIGEGAFAETDLTSIVIPNSVTTIGQSAFYGNVHATTLVIGTGISAITNDVFVGVAATSIVIPSNVKSIGTRAFKYASQATSITLPDGLESIGGDAFQNTASLVTISIPNSVYSLDATSFSGSIYTVAQDIFTRVAATAVARQIRIEAERKAAIKYESDRAASEIRASARSRALDALKSGSTPSASDLLKAGLDGINSHNVANLLAEISTTGAKRIEEIEKLAKKVVVVEKFSGDGSSILSMAKADLAAIGIVGMDGAYKATVLRSIANASPEKRASFEGIQALAKKTLDELGARSLRLKSLIAKIQGRK